MKKSISLLLVLCLLFSLTACGGSDNAPAPAPAPSPTPAPSPSPAPSPAPAPSPETPETPEAPTGSLSMQQKLGGGTAGYVEDGGDHWSRPPYNIVYFNFRPTNVTQQVTLALQQLGEKYNFSIEQLTANSDSDAYLNNLQTILLKEPDGLIVDITQELAPRVSEICRDYDTPVICIFNKAVDTEGVEIIPAVITDQAYNGRTQMNYLHDNYKNFWGDIDPKEINLLLLDWSQNMDINARSVGAEERWKELYPGQAYYYGDTGSDALSAESGFNVANGILSAHPEVKYWFIVSSVEDIALGATRAIEQLGLDDRVLMTASGAAILPGEWDKGYEGAWIANYAVPPFLYAGTSTFGLFALIEGRATNTTLWPDSFLPGDKAPRLSLEAEMMNKENYVDYIGDIMRSFGIEP